MFTAYIILMIFLWTQFNSDCIIRQLSASEQSAIASAAANPSSVLGGKISVKGEGFMVLRADDSVIYCRKVYFLIFFLVCCACSTGYGFRATKGLAFVRRIRL